MGTPFFKVFSKPLHTLFVKQVGYYLDESKNWSLDMSELQRAVDESRKICNPRVLVVINPGNPTGKF